MTKKKSTILILASVLALGSSIYAEIGEPGGQNDPIVSKSYVDHQIEALEKEIDVLNGQLQILALESNEQSETNHFAYELVTIPRGSSIIGMSGTEMIVRSGTGQVVAGEGGGIQNLTQGIDLVGGQQATKYHLLLIPREDGRGILATSELIVMVRGGYTIH